LNPLIERACYFFLFYRVLQIVPLSDRIARRTSVGQRFTAWRVEMPPIIHRSLDIQGWDLQAVTNGVNGEFSRNFSDHDCGRAVEITQNTTRFVISFISADTLLAYLFACGTGAAI
jgi:hypothetical protein